MKVRFPAVALCASLLAAPAFADELRCTGRIGAVQLDSIAVPDGATCRLQGTRAKGNIVVGNGARLRAEDVQVIGNLQCQQNSPAPRGGGNRAASKEDRCERL